MSSQIAKIKGNRSLRRESPHHWSTQNLVRRPSLSINFAPMAKNCLILCNPFQNWDPPWPEPIRMLSTSWYLAWRIRAQMVSSSWYNLQIHLRNLQDKDRHKLCHSFHWPHYDAWESPLPSRVEHHAVTVKTSQCHTAETRPRRCAKK
jgi:hypothetical protein